MQSNEDMNAAKPARSPLRALSSAMLDKVRGKQSTNAPKTGPRGPRLLPHSGRHERRVQMRNQAARQRKATRAWNEQRRRDADALAFTAAVGRVYFGHVDATLAMRANVMRQVVVTAVEVAKQDGIMYSKALDKVEAELRKVVDADEAEANKDDQTTFTKKHIRHPDHWAVS